MNNPLVSIIITTYAGSGVISRAISSVLQQSYQNWELIIVDDNNPETVERRVTEQIMQYYAKDKRIQYIKHEKNKNGSVARNTGIRNARGIYIAFLDDDDVFFPNRIERCVVELKAHPECDSVLTNVIVTDGNEVIDVIEQENHTDPLRDMFFGNPLGTGSNLFLTKRAINYLDGFDESFLRRQDIEFMIRFYKKFRSVYVNENLVAKIVEKREKVKIDYQKFRKIERHFISTFYDIIYGYLGEKDRKNYLDHTYTVLFRMALVSSTTDVKEASQDLLSVRSLYRREKIMVRFEKLYRICRNNNFLYGIKKRKEVLDNRRHVKMWLEHISNSEQNILATLKATKREM